LSNGPNYVKPLNLRDLTFNPQSLDTDLVRVKH